MRFLGPSDMISAATSLKDGVSTAIDEFGVLVELINRGGSLMSRAESLLIDAERLLARADAAVAQAEATIKGASVTVAESAAASLMANQALHDSQALLTRANEVLDTLAAAGRKETGASLGWPSGPAESAAPAARSGGRTAGRSTTKKAAAKATPAKRSAKAAKAPLDAPEPSDLKTSADDDFGLPPVEESAATEAGPDQNEPVA